MMNSRRRVVIVGAGIAGFTAAKTLAEMENGTAIVLVNNEDRPPYKRTKVSKNVAAGFTRDDYALAAPDWYGSSGVQLADGRQVISIDAAAHTLTLDSGADLEWDVILLATGSTAAVPTPQMDTAAGGAYVVRTAADVDRLRRALAHAGSVLVVGGGVLGVELAEQMRLAGARVTLSIRGSRLMPRELDERASDHLSAQLAANGVRLAASPAEGRFDATVYCIGSHADVRIAQQSGLAVRHGILVDRYLQTNIAGIFAAGDAAEHADGTMTHLWHAAEYQGALAARNISALLSGAADRMKPFDNPAFRLKCEVFGHYYFSVGRLSEDENGSRIEAPDGDRYRSYGFNGDRLMSVVMIDDPDRARQYQTAVREGWSRARVEEEFA